MFKTRNTPSRSLPLCATERPPGRTSFESYLLEQALQEYIGDGTMNMGDLMTVSHQGGRKKIQKRSWTEEEDAKLLELVRIHGTKVRGFGLLLSGFVDDVLNCE